MFPPCRPWRRSQTDRQTADKESSCARLPVVTFWCRQRSAARRLGIGDWWRDNVRRQAFEINCRPRRPAIRPICSVEMRWLCVRRWSLIGRCCQAQPASGQSILVVDSSFVRILTGACRPRCCSRCCRGGDVSRSDQRWAGDHNKWWSLWPSVPARSAFDSSSVSWPQLRRFGRKHRTARSPQKSMSTRSFFRTRLLDVLTPRRQMRELGSPVQRPSHTVVMTIWRSTGAGTDYMDRRDATTNVRLSSN